VKGWTGALVYWYAICIVAACYLNRVWCRKVK
jgi:hypothetical protein